MILINKQEAKAVREANCPNTIYRTVKAKSKRGHYYLSEELAGLKVVAEVRHTTVEELLGHWYKKIYEGSDS